MNRLVQVSQAVVLVALALLAAVPAHADGLTVIPISGTAQFVDEWGFSLSGPGLTFGGGILLDHSIFSLCTQGASCDLGGSLQPNHLDCFQAGCFASFNGGPTYRWITGTFNLVGSVLAPIVSGGSFTTTAPAAVYGQLFALNCPSDISCDYSTATAVFGFDIIGVGTVTANGIFFPNVGGPNLDAIQTIRYSFSGIAIETPEPSSWLLSLSGLGILGWIARKRKLLRKASFPSNAF